MKKVNVAFSLALLLVGGYCCATPASAKSNMNTKIVASVATSYAQGAQDGYAYAADLDARYGKGTPEYEEALETERAIAVRHAREVGYDPLYWRGYVSGLDNY